MQSFRNYCDILTSLLNVLTRGECQHCTFPGISLGGHFTVERGQAQGSCRSVVKMVSYIYDVSSCVPVAESTPVDVHGTYFYLLQFRDVNFSDFL